MLTESCARQGVPNQTVPECAHPSPQGQWPFRSMPECSRPSPQGQGIFRTVPECACPSPAELPTFPNAHTLALRVNDLSKSVRMRTPEVTLAPQSHPHFQKVTCRVVQSTFQFVDVIINRIPSNWRHCITHSRLSLPQCACTRWCNSIPLCINVVRLFGCGRRLEDRLRVGRVVVTMWDCDQYSVFNLLAPEFGI